MKPYHKIQTVWQRDPETNFRTLVEGVYATPEFQYLKSNDWYLTEKVDGTNIRVMWDGVEITFGGKTDESNMPPKLEKRLTEMFTERYSMFPSLFDGPVCLYGEGYGSGIQKGGGNYGDTPDFVLFDVKIGDWWLERHNVEDIAEKLDLRVVPTIGVGTLAYMIDYVRGGFDSNWGDFPAEGIVAQPTVPLVARNGKRVITKLKCKDFSVSR